MMHVAFFVAWSIAIHYQSNHTRAGSPYIAACQICSGVHTTPLQVIEHFLTRPGRGSSMLGDGMDVFFL